MLGTGPRPGLRIKHRPGGAISGVQGSWAIWARVTKKFAYVFWARRTAQLPASAGRRKSPGRKEGA